MGPRRLQWDTGISSTPESCPEAEVRLGYIIPAVSWVPQPWGKTEPHSHLDRSCCDGS